MTTTIRTAKPAPTRPEAKCAAEFAPNPAREAIDATAHGYGKTRRFNADTFRAGFASLDGGAA